MTETLMKRNQEIAQFEIFNSSVTGGDPSNSGLGSAASLGQALSDQLGWLRSARKDLGIPELGILLKEMSEKN